jgi:hypothetical protein
MKKEQSRLVARITAVQSRLSRVSGELQGLGHELEGISAELAAFKNEAESVAIPIPEILETVPVYRFGKKLDLSGDLSKIDLIDVLPPKELLDKSQKKTRSRAHHVLICYHGVPIKFDWR